MYLLRDYNGTRFMVVPSKIVPIARETLHSILAVTMDKQNKSITVSDDPMVTYASVANHFQAKGVLLGILINLLMTYALAR